MRPRYVVQVVADIQPLPVQPPVPQVPIAVPVASVVPQTQVSQTEDFSPQSTPRGRLQEDFLSTTPKTKESEAQPVPTFRTWTPGKPEQQQEPEDLFGKRAFSVEQAFRDQHIHSARQEEAIVRTPKKRGEATSPQAQNVQAEKNTRLEHLYQKMKPATPKKSERKGEGSSKKRVLKNKKAFIIPAFVLGAVMVLCVSIYSLFQWDLATLKTQSAALREDVSQVRLKSARERTHRIKNIVSRWTGSYRFFRPIIALGIGSESAHNLDISADLAARGVGAIETGLTAGEKVDAAFSEFTGKQEGDAGKTLQSVSGDLESLQTDLAALQAGFQRIDGDVFGIPLTDVRTTALSTLPRIRRLVLSLQQVSQIAPDILGKDRKQQYLVLFQNNQELRPTGGFIGSFALLTVQDGKLLDFHVEDVYEADGQLNGYVAPPVEIIQYLGEEQWFLRDVNWSPDFPTVAAQATWFLEKETGIKPDGVIGINLTVAQSLLGVTGPLTLPDYNEVITKDNLYERAEMHAEMNFFPGSTQKRDFLSAVVNQLFNQIMSDTSNKAALAEALVRSAEESQILISLQDPQVQKPLAALGWDGSVRTPECPRLFAEKECQVDTVMQVEANVGVNKANEYIQRSTTHHVSVDGYMAKHDRKVTLKNTARSDAWPQGAYRVFLRWFVSENAQSPEVLVNGKALAAEQIKTQLESGKRVIGAYVEVPIASELTVDVRYQVPLKSGTQVYALFEQKQSGTGDEPMQHEIEVLGKNVGAVAPEPEIDGRTLIFRSKRLTHDFMAVELE